MSRCRATLGLRATRRGFTLVELLVVIGIIALLVSILLPALNRARAQAQNIGCQSSLRQLAQWNLIYADDHKGIPMHTGNATIGSKNGWWELSASGWLGKVPAYWLTTKNSPLFCPMTRSVFGSDYRGKGFDNTDYSLSGWVGGNRRPQTKRPHRGMLTAKVMTFADAKFGIYAGAYYPWPSFELWSAHPENSVTYVPWPWDTSLPMQLGVNRGHPGNRANFAFGDGHVESLVREDYFNLSKDGRKAMTGEP